jgi:hypothetical protein
VRAPGRGPAPWLPGSPVWSPVCSRPTSGRDGSGSSDTACLRRGAGQRAAGPRATPAGRAAPDHPGLGHGDRLPGAVPNPAVPAIPGRPVRPGRPRRWTSRRGRADRRVPRRLPGGRERAGPPPPRVLHRERAVLPTVARRVAAGGRARRSRRCREPGRQPAHLRGRRRGGPPAGQGAAPQRGGPPRRGGAKRRGARGRSSPGLLPGGQRARVLGGGVPPGPRRLPPVPLAGRRRVAARRGAGPRRRVPLGGAGVHRRTGGRARPQPASRGDGGQRGVRRGGGGGGRRRQGGEHRAHRPPRPRQQG